MMRASTSIVAIVCLLATVVHGQQDCESGPAPPSDLGVFIWVGSDFEAKSDDKAAEERLGKADFLCQRTLESLFSVKFSSLVPISDVDFSTACNVPLENVCNFLTSCSSGRRRLTQTCMPFFGCALLRSVPAPLPRILAESEIEVTPPRAEQTTSMNIAFGICFDGACNIFVLNEGVNDWKVLGALAYRLCPTKFVKETVDGWTALHWTAAMDIRGILGVEVEPVEEAIDALVDAGGSLDARDARGRTPLHVASKWNAQTPGMTFIDQGVDLAVTDKEGNTALAIASFFGRDEAVKMLLAAGANPNVRYFDPGNSTVNFKTPLHFASLYTDRSIIVQMLIDAGARVNRKDGTGTSPLQIAEKYGREEVIKILKENGAR